MDAIAACIATYLLSTAAYRHLPLLLAQRSLPDGLTANTVWGTSSAPSPTPSSCFRWVARFGAGALGWWGLILAHLQRLASPSEPPGTLEGKAKSETKRRHLAWGWQLLLALEALADEQGVEQRRWPHLLLHAPSPPALDSSRWFARVSLRPP